MISRPLTPPCIPFGTRRFFSFHILLDNSQTWTCIPIWLLFFSKKFGSALVPFSSNLFYYMLVLSPSSVPYPMLLAFGILFLFSSIVSNRLPLFYDVTTCHYPDITILYNWETVHNPIYYPILLKTLPPTLNQLLKAHIIQSHVHLTYTSANY